MTSKGRYEAASMLEVQLSSTSYTGTRLPMGDFLFFPAIDTLRELHGPVKRVTIVSDERFSGNLLGDTLHVVLDRKGFANLRRELERRDPRERPITIQAQVDGDTTLVEFRVDDGKACARSLRHSGIEGLAIDENGEAPSSEASDGT